MKFIALSVLFFVLSFSASRAQFCIPEQAQAFYTRAMNTMNVKHVNWVKAVLTDLKSGKTTIDGVEAEAVKWANLNGLKDMDIDALLLIIMTQSREAAQEDLKAIMDGVKARIEQKKKFRDAVGMMKKRQEDVRSKARAEYMKRTEYDSLKRLLLAARIIQPIHLNFANLPKIDSVKRPVNPVTDNLAVKNLDVNLFAVTAAEFDKLLDDYRDKLDSMNEMGEIESLRLQMIMDRMAKFMSILSNLWKKFNDAQEQVLKNLK